MGYQTSLECGRVGQFYEFKEEDHRSFDRKLYSFLSFESF